MHQIRISEKREIIKALIKKQILITEKELKILEQLNNQQLSQFLKEKKSEIEKKIKYLQEKPLHKFSSISQPVPGGKIIIVKNYLEQGKKLSISDFIKYFKSRFKKIEKILQTRQKLQNTISINRLYGKKQREEISIIGLVADKNITKNNNIILTVEDLTGIIKIMINKNKPELYNLAKDLTLDEIIGVVGVNGENILFANNILLPDIPLIKELKKSHDEIYAAFLSDIHIGSNNFLEAKFLKFIKWINGELGNELQQKIANKVKYLFIIGDLVDGIGVYPNQDEELIIQDIYQQYQKCAELLKKIPKEILIILCPGNHDAVRISEPQPPLPKEIIQPLLDLPNVISVSNPALVNIHSSEKFPGFDVLMYHGYSFDYYAANIDSIRQQGGYDRADLIMKFLLQRRHLAPTHSSSLYVPGEEDFLVIDTVPDFFVTGHIHKTNISSYRNITLISGSCWQSKTSFQEKVGHNPEPCKVPIINLQTRNVKIINF